MGVEVPATQQAVEDEPGLLRLFAELRERHLFRIAAAYAVGAWLVIQVVDVVGPAFDLPPWMLRGVILAAIVGFLLTMGVLLFRPRREATGRHLVYLSPKARAVAGGGVLLIALAATALSIRSLSEREQVSLAVLPFADLSPTRDKAYFAEGVAEEILSTLAAEPQIKVLGRTSARQIERDPDPKAVRAALGVTHLLEGSTRSAGDQLRVNVRLIDTADGSQLWEEEYQGQMADVFTVQDQIAATVVRRLRGTFFRQAVRAAKQTSIDAYQTYLAARALMRTRSEETLTQALELAKQVVAVDPAYAPGRALLAELYMMLSDDPWAYGSIPFMEAQQLGLPHAREAIRLAPNKPEGHAALGLWLRDEQGVEPLRKAIELDPSRAEIRIWLGILLNSLGRHDEAFSEYRQALEIEPLWPVPVNRVVPTLATSGRIGEAVALVDQFRRRTGSEAQALRFTAHIRRAQNDISESVRLSRAALKLDPTLPYAHGWIVQQLGLLGLGSHALAEAEGVTGEYHRQLLAGDFQSASRLARREGARFWSRRDAHVGYWLLARARDWPTLVALYDRRPELFRDFCRQAPTESVAVAIGLRGAGRPGEAVDLLRCVQRNLNVELAQKMRSPDELPGRPEALQAAILAVQGDNRAMGWLERAVRAGWMGQYYSSRLADWPQFDAYRADPRLAALQRRIDQTIARERAETLRVLGRAS